MKLQYRIALITITAMLGMFALLGSIFIGYNIMTGIFLMFIFFGLTAILSVLLFVRGEEEAPPPILAPPPSLPSTWSPMEQEEKGIIGPATAAARGTCPQCGYRLEPNSNFCPACGAAID